MEYNTVVEGNKIIMEFMGAEIVASTKDPKGFMYKCRLRYKTCVVDYHFFNDKWNGYGDGCLKFHTSWDWLMPCVKKFDYLTENKVIETSADFEFWCDKIDDTVTRQYEILPVFKILVEAIQWYNTTKQSPHP